MARANLVRLVKSTLHGKLIVIPYVEKVSEAMKKHNVPVATKLWKTVKDLSVHQKDKQDKEEITECVIVYTRFLVSTVTRRM